MAPHTHPQATVLLSGGLDSSACAYFLQDRGFRVRGLFIDYGQAAARAEAAASRALAERLDIPIEASILSHHRGFGPGELLGRNSMLIFNALFLTNGETDFLALGLHAGVPYFDCSQTFVTSTGRFLAELTDGRVALLTPFIDWTKKDVYHYFQTTNLPLALTYSCESGTDPVCGTCASCQDRRVLGC